MMELFIDYTEGTQSSGDLSNYYTKSQTLSLVTEADKLNIAKIELSLGFKQAFNTAHKEFIKSGRRLVAINIYSDSGKSTKLFSKTFSYLPSGKLESVTILDEITGRYMTTSLSWLDLDLAILNKAYGGF